MFDPINGNWAGAKAINSTIFNTDMKRKKICDLRILDDHLRFKILSFFLVCIAISF